MRAATRLVVSYLLVLLARAPAAHAVVTTGGTQPIDFDRPEAWAMKYVTSVTLMSGMGPPRDLHLGSIRLMADAEWIPEVSDAQRVVGGLRFVLHGVAGEDVARVCPRGQRAAMRGR